MPAVRHRLISPSAHSKRAQKDWSFFGSPFGVNLNIDFPGLESKFKEGKKPNPKKKPKENLLEK
jgi:hypothetical protein